MRQDKKNSTGCPKKVPDRIQITIIKLKRYHFEQKLEYRSSCERRPPWNVGYWKRFFGTPRYNINIDFGHTSRAIQKSSCSCQSTVLVS